MKNIIKGIGNLCPKCRKPMNRKCHKEITDNLRNRAYYFSEWDVCKGCKHIQHYNEFKVMGVGMNGKIHKFHNENRPLFI